MRLVLVLPLLVLVVACAPPAPRGPADAEESSAPDMPPDLASYASPLGAMEKRWCYEVGNAPDRTGSSGPRSTGRAH